MKAAVADAVGAGFTIAEVELAHPLGREILIDVRASGLCHTELTIATQDIGVFPEVSRVVITDDESTPASLSELDHERLTMTSHMTIPPQEAADRLAIRELVDAYAHCADRRDAKGQMALFTEDTRFLVFYDLTSEEPSQELHGRESLAPVFDDLNQYVATMHFNGQSTISLDGDRATGESYCLAHHHSVAEVGQRTLMVASIRYLDEFVKQDGQWLFAERRLMVNWIDTRPSKT